MIIRKVSLEDKEQLKKLLHGFHIDDKKRFSSKLRSWEKYKSDEDVIENTTNEYLSDGKFIVYVADDKGKLVGYICGEIKEKPHKMNDKEGYVQDWFVELEYRHKNVGRMLFDALVGEFKKLKCTHMALDSFIENKHAIDTYHKMGFEDKLLVMRKDID